MSFTTSRGSRPINKEKNDSQQIFKKLSLLEAEKKIFQKQRESALQRVEKIGNRLVAIDHVIAELLTSLDLSVAAEDTTANKSKAVAQSALKSNHRAITESRLAANQRLVMRY